MAFFITLHLGGFAVLVAGFMAVFFNGRLSVEGRPAPWKRLWDRRWEAGILLGLLSVFSFYPVCENGKWFTYYGFPFFAGVSSEGDGIHGPGMISIALNFAFWLFLPQFVLWVTSGRRRVPGAGSPDSTPPA